MASGNTYTCGIHGQFTLSGTSTEFTSLHSCSTNEFNVSTESQCTTLCRDGGTISQMAIHISSNANTGTVTVRSRKNTANGNILITIATTLTGIFTDTSNSDTVTAGDLYDMSVASVSSGICTVFAFSWSYAPSGANDNVCMGSTNGSTFTTVAGRFIPGLGNGANKTSDSQDNRCRHKAAGTIKNGRILCSTNSRDGSAVYTMNKNAVNTLIAITIAAGITGWVFDGSDTVSVSVNDDINWTVTSLGGTTGNCVVAQWGYDFYPSSNGGAYPCGYYNVNGITTGANVTNWVSPFGGTWPAQTTETPAQISVRVAGTLSNGAAWVGTNTVTAASTITLRNNAADTGIVITVTASTTGWFTSGNTATVAVADKLAWKVVAGATGTNFICSQMIFAFTPTVSAVAAGIPYMRGPGNTFGMGF